MLLPGGAAMRWPPIWATLSMSTLSLSIDAARRASSSSRNALKAMALSTVSPASAIRCLRSFSVPPLEVYASISLIHGSSAWKPALDAALTTPTMSSLLPRIVLVFRQYPNGSLAGRVRAPAGRGACASLVVDDTMAALNAARALHTASRRDSSILRISLSPKRSGSSVVNARGSPESIVIRLAHDPLRALVDRPLQEDEPPPHVDVLPDLV